MASRDTHNITRATDVRTGNAQPANRSLIGVPVSNIVVESFAPIASDDDGIAAAQAVAGAGNLTINGALASSGAVTFDVPRNVVILSSNSGDTAQTATVYGYDKYDAPLQEVLTFNGTTPVLGLKAFYQVTRIAISAVLVGNATAGSGGKIGLSYAPKVGGFIRGRLNEDTADAGTYVAPIRTTSTATSANVRGTYAPAGTLNGTNVYTVIYAVTNGPNDTDAFGIAQYNG